MYLWRAALLLRLALGHRLLSGSAARAAAPAWRSLVRIAAMACWRSSRDDGRRFTYRLFAPRDGLVHRKKKTYSFDLLEEYT